ncbi:hypothetical protein GCM10009646_29010 [Streptomyces aureus]
MHGDDKIPGGEARRRRRGYVAQKPVCAAGRHRQHRRQIWSQLMRAPGKALTRVAHLQRP